MRKVWVCCVKGEDDVEMKLEQGSVASSHSSSSSHLHIDSINQYDKNLQGIKKIAFVTDLTVMSNWFLGFCALTWASAVLLGAYVSNLSMWDYYDVSLLLFVEGLRFGLAAYLRLLGYRLSDFTRWSLESIAFFLPLAMGGFAVLSILPYNIHIIIHHRFIGQSTSPPPALDHAPPPSGSPYASLYPSLYIFYGLVILNTFVLLLGSSVTGLMRQRYVKSNVKSLCKYHDKMLDSTTSWLRPTVDLDFAFQIQGSQYRNGRHDAKYVCQNYGDLIWYLYKQKGGVEAAEAALAAEDRYVREAAANIIGFWAILDTVVPQQASKPCPLCFQREMLSKLADIAAESYGSLGTAAARSFMLLLMSVDLELIGLVANVQSKSSEKDLIEVLLGRAAELLHPPYPPTCKLPRILQERSHAHIYALREYIGRIQSASESKDTYIGDQRAQLEKRIKAVLPELEQEGTLAGSNLIQNLNKQLCSLVPEQDDYESDMKSTEGDDYKNYEAEIKRYLTGDPSQADSRSIIKATFLVLFNVAVPLVCLGVGFIVSALV